MKNFTGEQPNKEPKPQDGALFKRVLGAATPSKASGVAFSFAAVLPVLLSLVFLIVITATGLTEKTGYETSDWYLYVSYLLPQLSFALVAIWYLSYTKTPVKEAVRAQKCHPKYFLIALLLQIGLFSLSELNGLFLELLSRFGYTDGGILLPSMDGFGFIGVLLVVAVFPAVFEEIMFRGVLLNGLRSFKSVGAILLCGGLFSLYHQNPAQTLYQFCCGAAFAFVALRAGSILPTMLAHFINNATILILTRLGINGFSTPAFIAIVAVSAVCLVLSLGYLIFLDKKQKGEKNEDKGEQKRFFLCAAVGIAACALSWLLVLFTGL
ncbi:MAG: CPBP family intramembrane metalloprotease [Clostridia bacterium]|nr:CPBP family intramembrane metalloprotease [Clostridia bacterium]